MTPKTSNDYQKLTEHFFLKKLKTPLSISGIKSALLDSALDYRPAYWRRLKRAIQHTLEIHGRFKAAKVIGALKNPITEPDSPLSKLKKPKQKRVKRVSQEEHDKLLNHFIKKSDSLMLGALEIVKILGCRPSELFNLKLLGESTVFISGAKKTEDGLRGLDRTLILDDKTFKRLLYAFNLLNLGSSLTTDKTVVIKRLQRRLQTATKSIWRRRHHHITFYSYRHQLGSDLKSSGIPPKSIAAIMGHQSTVSVDSYGDRRSVTGRHVFPSPNQQTINKVRTPTSKLPLNAVSFSS